MRLLAARKLVQGHGRWTCGNFLRRVPEHPLPARRQLAVRAGKPPPEQGVEAIRALNRRRWRAICPKA